MLRYTPGIACTLVCRGFLHHSQLEEESFQLLFRHLTYQDVLLITSIGDLFLHNDTLVKWDCGANWLSAFTGVPIYRDTHTDTSGCFCIGSAFFHFDQECGNTLVMH